MWVFRLLCNPWILWQIPIVSRVRVLVMRDFYISLHSPGLRMLKRWGKCDLGVREQRKLKEEDELLYFPFRVCESYGRASSHESLWAGQVRQTLHNFGSTSELCITSLLFLCFSYVIYKVGRNSRHKVSSRHMMQWWYYLSHMELHNGWWVLDA